MAAKEKTGQRLCRNHQNDCLIALLIARLSSGPCFSKPFWNFRSGAI